MPYNPGTGIYTLPAIYLAIPGTTIIAAQHNQPLEDLEVANNYARPVVAGGTGANTPATARASLGVVDFPIGSVIDYAGTVAPGLWLLCFGQSLATATYPALFAVIGYTYGGAGLNFNLPDARGRVVAGQDDMGGVSANRLTSPLNGDTLGAAGGVEGVTLTQAQTPIHFHTFSDTATTGNASANHQHGGGATSSVAGSSQTSMQGGAPNGGTDGTDQPSGSLHTHTVTVGGNTSSIGGGGSHDNVQPTIILNKIIYAGV